MLSKDRHHAVDSAEQWKRGYRDGHLVIAGAEPLERDAGVMETLGYVSGVQAALTEMDVDLTAVGSRRRGRSR